MSIPKQISDFLDSHHVPYQYCRHSLAYTAQGIAHAQHISGKAVAKVVMVIADGTIHMTVLPASHRIDFDRLRMVLGARELRLATEEEFKNIFAGCETGAMPPFGNLYSVNVWVDESLNVHEMIVFNAGTHVETIQMQFSDFLRLVNPRSARFAELHH